MKKYTGIKRIMYAFVYSWQGFRSALANETAFLQECVIAVLLGVLSFYLDVSAYERLAMLISLGLVLIIELINSAIECVADRVDSGYHVLSGRAKDYGSLAVLFSIVMTAAIWIVILV